MLAWSMDPRFALLAIDTEMPDRQARHLLRCIFLQMKHLTEVCRKDTCEHKLGSESWIHRQQVPQAATNSNPF